MGCETTNARTFYAKRLLTKHQHSTMTHHTIPERVQKGQIQCRSRQAATHEDSRQQQQLASTHSSDSERKSLSTTK